jgi:NADP-dependent 3-hydroxy acid dehydrogenase YdfG
VRNKVIIITGASSGIGKACALEFFKKGARLVLVSRTESKLMELTEFINSQGGHSIYVVGDVSNESDCIAVINKTIEVYGEIDILLNNAGISMRALFSDLDLSVFDKVMKVNFYGTLYCHINILKYILQNIMVKAF